MYNLGTEGGIIVALSRFAVPFFFLLSGFFSYFEDASKAIEKYKVRCIRLLKLLIVSNIIYFIFYDVIRDFSISKWMSLIDVGQIYQYIIFNTSPTGGHLWFIQSLIYCYLLFFIMTKLDIKINKLYVYIPILLIFNLILGEFSRLTANPYSYYFHRNFFFTALPFFVLGYLIRDKKEKLDIISNKFIIYSIALGILLTVLEFLTIGTVELYIGSIILATIIFIWCIINPEKLDWKISGWIGGKLYTPMYILHLIVYYSLIVDVYDFGYLSPIVVFLLTVVISYFVYRIDKGLKIGIFS